MSSTAQDLISAALRKIGVLASGEALGANEATDGLTALNRFLDSCSTENLLIPAKIRETFALVVGQQTYQMGVGAADFNTARPQKIEDALLQYTGVNPAIELPMAIYTKEEYAEILLKTLQSPIPMCIYPDYAYPNCAINVWPVPAVAYNIIFYSWKPLTSFSALTTSVSFPPGYEEFLIYGLAVRLAPEYGKVVPVEVAEIAISSKAAIKRMNIKPRFLKTDPALQGKSAVFDYRTGGFK